MPPQSETKSAPHKKLHAALSALSIGLYIRRRGSLLFSARPAIVLQSLAAEPQCARERRLRVGRLEQPRHARDRQYVGEGQRLLDKVDRRHRVAPKEKTQDQR
eukprot:7390045-Prymnesium_polylepis.2